MWLGQVWAIVISRSFLPDNLTASALRTQWLIIFSPVCIGNWPRGMVWGGRRDEGSGWGTHVYLWWIHFDIWQNQYNTVKFKNKIKFKKIKNKKNPVANCSTMVPDIFDLSGTSSPWIKATLFSSLNSRVSTCPLLPR